MTDRVMVFAPAPILTVTIEQQATSPELHVHPGGQGVWQARMIAALGTPVVLCCALGGKTGDVLGRQLAAEQDVHVRNVPRRSGTGWYVHDRRDGSRSVVAEHPGDPLERHDLDELYTLALTEGRAAGDDVDALLDAGRKLRDQGAEAVLISRADQPALALLGDRAIEVHPPVLQVTDHRGAGDSMTAGVAAVLARGGDLTEAVRTGAAAGALNVTRHGLGTVRAEAVQELLARVRIEDRP